MKQNELTTPIRMYWDIGKTERLAPSDYPRIAGEIATNRFLSLQITETERIPGETLLAALKVLEGKPIAISLALSLQTAEDRSFVLPSDLPLKTIYLAATTLTEVLRFPHVRERLSGRHNIGISYPVTAENHRDLPAVLSHCVEHGIRHLHLPMQRLIRGEQIFWLTVKEQKALADRLSRIERPEGLTITIHDPFLWTVFNSGADFPGGGCQAANTLLYISTEGDVYPCPSFPVRIGILTSGSLKEILGSGEKEEVRRRIIALPEGCIACDGSEQCKGGCRGRAYAMKGSFDDPDPACR